MARETTLGKGACQIWGVLNVTPDSFSDGGEATTVEAAFAKAARLAADGADVVDVGGASSRPAGATYGAGAPSVSVADECARVVPVIERLVRELRLCVSADTTRAEVAKAALSAGASIVNDVSGGAEAALLEVVASHGAELVLMHNRGDGRVAGTNIEYGDVAHDVAHELRLAVERAVGHGVAREKIWIDPGIGFAKTAAQSLAALASLASLRGLGQRILVGPSRKSFIAEIEKARSGAAPAPGERLGGTAAAVSAAVLLGADAVRVHDVREMRQAVWVCEALAAQSKRGFHVPGEVRP